MKKLLRKALVYLEKNSFSYEEFTLGGGTALNLFLNKRISKDIDIFILNQQRLNYLNPEISRYVFKDFKEYSVFHNFIKFDFDINNEKRQIDFILAVMVLDFDFAVLKVGLDEIFSSDEVKFRSIYIETPEEIISKKIRYRAESFSIRDIFDLSQFIKYNENFFKNINNIKRIGTSRFLDLKERIFLLNNEEYLNYVKEKTIPLIKDEEIIENFKRLKEYIKEILNLIESSKNKEKSIVENIDDLLSSSFKEEKKKFPYKMRSY